MKLFKLADVSFDRKLGSRPCHLCDAEHDLKYLCAKCWDKVYITPPPSDMTEEDDIILIINKHIVNLLNPIIDSIMLD